MVAEDNDLNKWRQLNTYFSGKFSMFVTYPILMFALGIIVGYLMSG